MIKVHKLFIISAISAFLFSCTPSSSSGASHIEFDLDTFYSDIRGRNFKASDDELTFIYYDEDAIKIQLKDQVDTAVVRMNQGLFEIYKTSDGYNSHGMITPNVNMDLADSFNNFYRITYLNKNLWSYNKNNLSYRIYATQSLSDLLMETGFIYSYGYESLNRIELSKNKDGYDLDIIYSDTSPMKDDSYTVKITDIGTCEDSELSNYIKNTTLEPQTEWNEYQLSAMEQYEFKDVPFLSSYTLGLKLYFMSYSGSYMLFVYDYMSSKAKEADIAQELVEFGFKNETNATSSIKKYSKVEEGTKYKLVIEFKFVPVDEIEGDANKEAFPNGYMQLVHSYSLAEDDTTLSAMNEKLAIASLPALPNSTAITKVTTVDYKDATNASFMSDEGLEIFKELDLEPGPIYDEYRSIYLHITDEATAVTYLDNYRSLVKGNNFEASPYVDDTKSIGETTNAAYLKYNSTDDDFPMYEVYIYLYDYSIGGEWTGVCEIIFAKLTDLGVQFYGLLQ